MKIEDFLSAHSAAIPARARAIIRGHVMNGKTAQAVSLLPDHLKNGLRAALEADYRARVAGQKFTLKKEYLP
jgi:hypothetical protein